MTEKPQHQNSNLSTSEDRSFAQETLREYIGERLSSITFVLKSYLQLSFDGTGQLTPLVWPEVIDSNRRFSYGEPEYLNCIYRMLERVVVAADINERDEIIIRFEPDGELFIRLADCGDGGERAILQGRNNSMMVL